jgi:hypothetical protein
MFTLILQTKTITLIIGVCVIDVLGKKDETGTNTGTNM